MFDAFDGYDGVEFRIGEGQGFVHVCDGEDFIRHAGMCCDVCGPDIVAALDQALCEGARAAGNVENAAFWTGAL